MLFRARVRHAERRNVEKMCMEPGIVRRDRTGNRAAGSTCRFNVLFLRAVQSAATSEPSEDTVKRATFALVKLPRSTLRPWVWTSTAEALPMVRRAT